MNCVNQLLLKTDLYSKANQIPLIVRSKIVNFIFTFQIHLFNIFKLVSKLVLTVLENNTKISRFYVGLHYELLNTNFFIYQFYFLKSFKFIRTGSICFKFFQVYFYLFVNNLTNYIQFHQYFLLFE